MNLVKSIDQYDDNCIFFCDPIKNNIMPDGKFIRILYSNENLVLNGVYLLVIINDYTCEKYYNKYRCCFNNATHLGLIQGLKEIEESILHKINIPDKTPQFKIYEQFNNGSIKVFNEVASKSSNDFIIKISGIWETPVKYGLTYKIIKTID
jgi:hypothetical protein